MGGLTLPPLHDDSVPAESNRAIVAGIVTQRFIGNK